MKAKSEETKTIGVRLSSVGLLGVSFPVRSEPMPHGVKYYFDMHIEQTIQFDQDKITVVFGTKIYNTEDSGELFGGITTACEFHAEKGELDSLTISTSRGIMASEFRGTYLNEAILPIIDPSGFLASRKSK